MEPASPQRVPSLSFQSRPILVSFSGIDGAGKSTQIERLHQFLGELGISDLRLAFWDDVVVLPHLRAGVSHKLLGGELGVGAPGKPVRRNDKNARTWYLTLVRSLFYFFDVLSLRKLWAKARVTNADVIVFDRYIYDQLANISGNWAGRLYIGLLLSFAPRPHVAFLLDADPATALARKPEYPLDFLDRYRRSHLRLSQMAPEMVVVPPGRVEDVERVIRGEFLKRCPQLPSQAVAGPEPSKSLGEDSSVRVFSSNNT
ncbi:MAG: thymidylate kinase [Acidobacteria bacterium]|nr:thymidylate kinase [Acidobacteriota bacterium]